MNKAIGSSRHGKKKTDKIAGCAVKYCIEHECLLPVGLETAGFIAASVTHIMTLSEAYGKAAAAHFLFAEQANAACGISTVVLLCCHACNFRKFFAKLPRLLVSSCNVMLSLLLSLPTIWAINKNCQ